MGYAYDDAGRETSITYPGGTNQVAYAYDAANRLSTVTDWNSNATTYAYDDANRMASTTLPNGVVSSYAYDNANRLTGISHVKGGTTLASAAYTVDAVANRSDRTDLAGTQSYGYDNLYRLTSVTYPGPTTTTYSYDAFGNRTQMVDASGATGYTYDDADRLTSVTPPSPAPVVSYTWDNNGNLTDRGSDSFSWDYEDRMLSATVGGTTWTYAYRGDGLRNSATTGGVTKTFTWDVNAGLPVILDDGAQYIYGAGLVAQVSGANTYYYLADGLGSTMATTDASGNVINSYTYDVYGKTTASSGSQGNDFQFAAQQTDPAGVQYLRARYYDPETGGFLSRDPMAISPRWLGSQYRYASANPVVDSDPSGNICIGPLCADRDGVSWGGHELVEGATEVGQRLWWNERQTLNRPLSAAAEVWARNHGGNCKSRQHGIVICYGMEVGSIPDGHSALTIGNVVMTLREKNEFDDRLFAHEEKHADQWALSALACSANPAAHLPVVGGVVSGSCSAVIGGSLYQLFPGFFENWAGMEDGCYGDHRRPSCAY